MFDGVAMGVSLVFPPLLAADQLRQAAKAVADVALSNHLVEVIFSLFDENSQFHLSVARDHGREREREKDRF